MRPTLCYASYDDFPEDTELTAHIAVAAASAGIRVRARGFRSAGPLSEFLLRRASMTILSAHAPTKAPEGSWCFSRPGHYLTLPQLFPKGELIPARVVLVATCNGNPTDWLPYLEAGALAITWPGDLNYSAVRRVLEAFLPELPGLISAQAPAEELREVWNKSRARAIPSANTLRHHKFEFAIGREFPESAGKYQSLV